MVKKATLIEVLERMILYNCGPKCCDNGSLAAKTLSNQMKDYMGYVQRLSP